MEKNIKEPQATGIVTFLDVLGWKGVYDRKLDAIASLTQLIQGVNKRAEEQRGRISQVVQVKSISDTIAIFSFCAEAEIATAIEIHGELCAWRCGGVMGDKLPGVIGDTFIHVKCTGLGQYNYI